jgi:hypothetical protein
MMNRLPSSICLMIVLAAAAAVRDGKSDRAQFEKVIAETLAFYRTLALSWAVSIDHNYSYVRRGLGLKPNPR